MIGKMATRWWPPFQEVLQEATEVLIECWLVGGRGHVFKINKPRFIPNWNGVCVGAAIDWTRCLERRFFLSVPVARSVERQWAKSVQHNAETIATNKWKGATVNLTLQRRRGNDTWHGGSVASFRRSIDHNGCDRYRCSINICRPMNRSTSRGDWWTHRRSNDLSAVTSSVSGRPLYAVFAKFVYWHHAQLPLR